MSQKRGHAHQGSSLGVNLGLVVTPMLDMSFQLLAFFIMTYHPSALEGHIPGNLAPPQNPAIHQPNHDPVKDPEMAHPVPEHLLLDDLKDVVLIQIKANVKGQDAGNRSMGTPRQLFLKTTLDVQAEMVGDVDDDFGFVLQRLEAKLKEMAQKNAGQKSHLKIVADSELRQQYVLRVYDACKRVGFDKIYFVPPPVLNAKLK